MNKYDAVVEIIKETDKLIGAESARTSQENLCFNGSLEALVNQRTTLISTLLCMETVYQNLVYGEENG